MADKNTGIGREQVGSRSNEQVTGREGSTPAERAGEYATPDVGRRSSTVASTTTPAGESTDARTRNIRAEIEQTREEMSETVNEIQDRLRPGTIASNAAESIRDAASERVNDLAESDSAYYVRANPVPTAMVGIGIAGLAWLAFGGRDADEARRSRYRGASRGWRSTPRRYETDDRYRTSSAYSDYESGAYDYESPAVGQAETGIASQLSGRTSEMGRELRGTAEQASRRVQQRAYRAQTQLQRTWNESPLLIGAAAAVLGALIGSALPETERENQLMGDARDNMIEGVEQAVKGKVEEVQNAATDAVSQVQKAAGLTSSDEESPSTGASQKKTGSTGTTPGQTRSTSGH